MFSTNRQFHITPIIYVAALTTLIKTKKIRAATIQQI